MRNSARACKFLQGGNGNSQVIERLGGASRDRTDDLIVANDALSQLSYSPIPCEDDRCDFIRHPPLNALRTRIRSDHCEYWLAVSYISPRETSTASVIALSSSTGLGLGITSCP